MTLREWAALNGRSYEAAKKLKQRGLLVPVAGGFLLSGDIGDKGGDKGGDIEAEKLSPAVGDIGDISLSPSPEPVGDKGGDIEVESLSPEPVSLEPLSVALEEVAALREVIERQQEQIDRLTTRVVEIENQIGEFEPDAPLAMDGANVGEKLDEVLARLGAIESFLRQRAGYQPTKSARYQPMPDYA